VKKKIIRTEIIYSTILSAFAGAVATPFIECSVGIGNIPPIILANITNTPSAQIIKVNRLLP